MKIKIKNLIAIVGAAILLAIVAGNIASDMHDAAVTTMDIADQYYNGSLDEIEELEKIGY